MISTFESPYLPLAEAARLIGYSSAQALRGAWRYDLAAPKVIVFSPKRAVVRRAEFEMWVASREAAAA